MNRRSVVHVTLACAALFALTGGLALSRGIPASSDELGWLGLALAIVMTAAVGGGHLASRFGQPAVLGELLAGVLLGNLPGLRGLRFVGADPHLDILSRVGMLLLLFEVGLDLSVRDLFAVGSSSLLVAVIGTISSLALGAGVAASLLPGASGPAHIFLGAAITATSVGITARVLKDVGASRSAEARVILGAAVVDDVLALVVLGAVTAWVGLGRGAGASSATSIAALVMKTAGFLILAIVLGGRLTPIWFRRAARLRTRGALLAAGLCFCFVLSWAASAIGLAALVGAFAAGLVLEDAHSEIFVQRGEPSLSELLEPMILFLVPVFFVLVGIRVNLHVLGNPVILVVAIALAAAAVLGKLTSALGVLDHRVNRLTVGVGMIPRGEVTLVFAALGSRTMLGSSTLLDERAYVALVAVVILSTLVTPPLLKWSLTSKSGTSGGITQPAA